MKTTKTYRRAPSDLKQVAHIVKLLDADVDARGEDLAKSNKAELRELLNWQAEWQEIHTDLATEEKAITAPVNTGQPTQPESKPPTEAKSEASDTQPSKQTTRNRNA